MSNNKQTSYDGLGGIAITIPFFGILFIFGMVAASIFIVGMLTLIILTTIIKQ